MTLILLNFSCANSQENKIDQNKIEEDFEQIISDIKNNYIYLNDKKVDIDCIYSNYKQKIKLIDSEDQRLLFFEYLLDEFYDSHVMLMRAIRPSYRLDSPIFTVTNNGKAKIKNVWQTQIENIDLNIIGSEVLKINGIDLITKIEKFPTICNDKNDFETRNWITNKIIAGKYNEPRVLTLKLSNGKIIDFDLDKIKLKKKSSLLTLSTINNIGIIRLNNSLGQNALIEKFDSAIDRLQNTKGLIIDLRNTTGGGNSYVARGIMSRFINESMPYQLHQIFDESWDNQPIIKRSWAEHVSPRNKQYKNPVVVLVGKWTGSMGEGLAIGFDGLGRAEIVGTEMKRLAGGSTNNFHLKNENLDYKLTTEKLFHLNGTPREKYIPENYVSQSSTEKDETLEKGIELINKMTE
ncbi:S41 family peptidase [Psychroserpens sp. NJDZ02]|uniref:S41 family peptidase n=1 Tax=Psychroserpens sp. NJDZ02 TaxID=2570561 RepID=UPI0014562859|nr:S41 family peptidase [Psychroserpens sp. NJDZ02]